MFFSPSFDKKGNLEAKIMQSAYLCVIFHVKHKKNTISRGFNLSSTESVLILGKLQDGGQDGDHCW